MKPFELTRADDPGQAIAVAEKANTAQQGADIRFIAGGTNLVDYMKLNVETPRKLVDVNHLPFDKIESASRRRPEDRRNGSQFRSRLSSNRPQKLRRTF